MSTVQYIEDVLGANGGILPTDPGKVGVAADIASATNAAATVTYAAAGTALANVVGAIFVSLSAAPVTTPVTLTVQDGATTIFSIDIIAAGPTVIPFSRNPLKGSANTAMTVNLTTGGTAIVGKVNVRHWTE